MDLFHSFIFWFFNSLRNVDEDRVFRPVFHPLSLVHFRPSLPSLTTELLCFLPLIPLSFQFHTQVLNRSTSPSIPHPSVNLSLFLISKSIISFLRNQEEEWRSKKCIVQFQVYKDFGYTKIELLELLNFSL